MLSVSVEQVRFTPVIMPVLLASSDSWMSVLDVGRVWGSIQGI